MHLPPAFRLIDLGQPVFDGCPRCPSDPPVRSELIADHPTAGWRVEHLSLSSHTGSHLDAPLHKLPGGPAIDAFPLDRFVAPALLLDLRSSRPKQPFTSTMLTRTLPAHTDLQDKVLLLATGWGDKRNQTSEWENHAPFLSPDGAQWLVDQEVRGVGIDHYSIGGSQEPSNSLTHQVLLEANIWIAEDLHYPAELFSVPQPFQFWCLPILLPGHSGAFCRPVAVVAG